MNYDSKFLSLLDRVKIKKQFIRIIILSFDEKEIRDIKGTIASGTLNVNGSSAVRRTINLSMYADADSNNLTNLENIISLNKKVRVEVGYENPLTNYRSQYGEIIWFPCGTYIITSATISSAVTGLNISIQGKDKMGMLDGTAGGTLPASVTFSEVYIDNGDGTMSIEYPTIHQIIQEAVNHYGCEPLKNIIISDIAEDAKMLMKYVGDTPIWFVSSTDHSSFVISDTKREGYDKRYAYGEDIGYTKTDFTYPGDLTFAAGSTVAQVLDKIAKTLGNFEYFYDVNGNFIFQEVKNYLNTSYTPLCNLQGAAYVKSFSNSKYAQAFDNDETVVSFNNNPKYDNIKNDFIVWGQRTTTSGTTREIRFHLAVDEKPAIDLANRYMWAIADPDGEILRYAYTDTEDAPAANAELIGKPCQEWREELYRIALGNALDNGEEGFYDDELIAEWRKIFDTLNEDWEEAWIESGLGIWEGWNPDVNLNPAVLDFWLDFIDSSTLGQYSVNMIGRRTKVINDTNLKSIYNMEVPDVVFIENKGNLEDLYDLFTEYKASGQDYCLLQPEQMEYFSTSSTGSSCYDKIRELLYQNLTYNSTITITCVPRYYFEPNQLIYVKDNNTGIQGSFVISQFSLPLQYSGTMSITATEALTRV